MHKLYIITPLDDFKDTSSKKNTPKNNNTNIDVNNEEEAESVNHNTINDPLSTDDVPWSQDPINSLFLIKAGIIR